MNTKRRIKERRGDEFHKVIMPSIDNIDIYYWVNLGGNSQDISKKQVNDFIKDYQYLLSDYEIVLKYFSEYQKYLEQEKREYIEDGYTEEEAEEKAFDDIVEYINFFITYIIKTKDRGEVVIDFEFEGTEGIVDVMDNSKQADFVAKWLDNKSNKWYIEDLEEYIDYIPY